MSKEIKLNCPHCESELTISKNDADELQVTVSKAGKTFKEPEPAKKKPKNFMLEMLEDENAENKKE
jgi:hypothetical protein